MANSIDETLKAIEREQNERHKQNEEQVGKVNSTYQTSNVINSIASKYNSPKTQVEQKQKGEQKESVAPVDRSRYTIKEMSDANRTFVSRTFGKVATKINKFAGDYRQLVAPLNNSTLRAYENLLGISDPRINKIRELNADVQDKIYSAGAIASVVTDGIDVAKHADQSYKDQRIRRLSRTKALSTRSAGNIHSALRAGDSIARLGLSLGNAGRVSSLIFGDGTGNTGLPKVMDVLEKSLRPITKSGVRDTLGVSALQSTSSPVLQALAKPLESAVNTVAGSLTGLHSVIKPLTKTVTVYSNAMAKVNNLLFNNDLVKGAVGTMRKASIGNLSSFSMASGMIKPLQETKMAMLGKMDDFGMLGGVGKLYGGMFMDMGIQYLTTRLAMTLGKVIQSAVKSIRDAGKQGLKYKIKPRELRFKETTTDEILKRYGGDPEMAQSTINQLTYMKDSTITPQESALYLATDAIRRNTSPIPAILAYLENSQKTKDVFGSKVAQNELAQLTSSGGGNLATSADMVGPTEKFLNWIGDKANVIKLLLPSANISNTLRGLSTTKMLKDLEAERLRENYAIDASRNLGVNIDDYMVLHSTPAKLMSKGKTFESKSLILMGSQLQVQQYIAKEILTIRKSSGIKDQVTLSDETFTQSGIANAIDNLLGYIPMYALLSRTVGSAFKLGRSLLPDQREQTLTNLKNKTIDITKHFVSDTAKYFTSERDLLNQLKDMYRDKTTGRIDAEHERRFQRFSDQDLFNKFYVQEYPKLFQEQTAILDKTLMTQIQILMNVEAIAQQVTGTTRTTDKSYLTKAPEIRIMNSRTGEFETIQEVQELNAQIEQDIKNLIRRREGATSFLDFAFKFPKDMLIKGVDLATGGKLMNTIEQDLLGSGSVASVLQDNSHVEKVQSKLEQSTSAYQALLTNGGTGSLPDVTVQTSLEGIQTLTEHQLAMDFRNIRISDLSAHLFFKNFEDVLTGKSQDKSDISTEHSGGETELNAGYGFVDKLRHKRDMFTRTLMNYTVVGELLQTLAGKSATRSRRQQSHEAIMEERFNEVTSLTGLNYSEVRMMTVKVDTILSKSNQSLQEKQLMLNAYQMSLLQIVAREVTAIRTHFGANQLINRTTEASKSTFKTAVSDTLGHIPLYTLVNDLTKLAVTTSKRFTNKTQNTPTPVNNHEIKDSPNNKSLTSKSAVILSPSKTSELLKKSDEHLRNERQGAFVNNVFHSPINNQEMPMKKVAGSDLTYNEQMALIKASNEQNKVKWETPKQLHVADMKPQEFFNELKKATTEETSLLGSIKDGFMDKFKSLKTPASCGNCCCDSSDSFEFDRDKDKKKRKRTKRTKRRTKSLTKSVTKSVSKSTSKIGSVLNKAKKFVSPITDVAKKVVGNKGFIETAKLLGKKALTKVGGAGVASMLGPIGLGLYGAYNVYDAVTTASDLFGSFFSDDKKEQVNQQVVQPAKIESKELETTPVLQARETQTETEKQESSVVSEIEKLVGKFVEVSSNQAKLIASEINSLKRETTSLMEKQLETVNPVVINGQPQQSQSSDFHVINQPFNFEQYFDDVNTSFVNSMNDTLNRFLTK